jgi:formate dehydrogenase iron-sulfur subunit
MLMTEISRRDFLRGAVASGVAGALAVTAAPVAGAAVQPGTVGTLIDLTLCDGCPGQEMPACVHACREQNQARFPKVDREKLQPYWPQSKYEDWSDKQHLTDRLTPYNWSYVQKVTVTHDGREQELSIPRRCMHCDNPPCANACPFAASTKAPEGPVLIDDKLCMGGAKCRDVCPWDIPQRQAGAGLYLDLAPKFAGGGVMYKCDLCIDRVRDGKAPACVEACPRGAIVYGRRDAVQSEAHRRARAMQGYIYGEEENGGTSTLYVSAVPFEAIHEAMLAQSVDGNPGRPAMPVAVRNFTDAFNGLAAALFASPVVGMVAAGVLALSSLRNRGRANVPTRDDSEIRRRTDGE